MKDMNGKDAMHIYVRAEIEIVRRNKEWGFVERYIHPMTGEEEVIPIPVATKTKRDAEMLKSEIIKHGYGMAGWWMVRSLDEVKCNRHDVFVRAE